MNEELIVQKDFHEYLQDATILYAKEVIKDRAIPAAEDGLKPVHRRIMQTMYHLGLHPGSVYKKSARTVGDCLGLYHPHGDQSVYQALVGMAQDFKMKYPLVDGHGNFGSVDGDPAAAMRYTESKLTTVGELMMSDIDKDTVNFQPNYDESEDEATVLPGLLPLLLMNGSSGIAVGMASSFVPHLAKDVFKAADKMITNRIDDEETSIEDLIHIIKAPDFPTGGIIVNMPAVRKGYISGKGSVTIKSRYTIEDEGMIVTEIPYGVNKAKLVEDIALGIRDGKFEELKHVVDESDRDGMRIVIQFKKGANEQLAVNKLLKMTQLTASVQMNHQALVNGNIKEHLNLKELVECFVNHAMSVVKRKSQFVLDKKSKRLHIVEAFLVIAPDIMNCIKMITESETDEDIYDALRVAYNLDDEQINAIISRQIRSLKKLSEEEFVTEAEELLAEIEHLTAVVTDEKVLLAETKEALDSIAVRFAKETRQTEISLESADDITEKELTAKEDVVLVRTHNGMMKMMKLSDYNSRNRGAKGISLNVDEDDFVQELLTVTTHDLLVFITNTGKGIMLPAYKIPIASRTAKCKYMHNYVKFNPNEEKIVAIIPVDDEHLNDEHRAIVFASKNGIIKKLAYKDLPSRVNNAAAIVRIRENDEIVSCIAVEDDDYLLLATKNGYALKFKVNAFRCQGRAGSGVTGIKFKAEGDYLIAAMVANDEDTIMVVTENGLGKRTKAETFNEHGRGTGGMVYHKANKKSGTVVNVMRITDDDTLIMLTQNGMLSRVNADTISVMGRTAAGVKVITLNENDSVVLATAAPKTESEDDEDGIE